MPFARHFIAISYGRFAGSPDWWLSGATLEIQKGGMGGDQYGGAKAAD